VFSGGTCDARLLSRSGSPGARLAKREQMLELGGQGMVAWINCRLTRAGKRVNSLAEAQLTES
jgi:hypothetical protein